METYIITDGPLCLALSYNFHSAIRALEFAANELIEIHVNFCSPPNLVTVL